MIPNRDKNCLPDNYQNSLKRSCRHRKNVMNCGFYCAMTWVRSARPGSIFCFRHPLPWSPLRQFIIWSSTITGVMAEVSRCPRKFVKGLFLPGRHPLLVAPKTARHGNYRMSSKHSGVVCLLWQHCFTNWFRWAQYV